MTKNRALLAVGLILLMGCNCASSSQRSAAAPEREQPSADFRQVHSSDLAGTTNNLLLAVAGAPSGRSTKELAVRAYRSHGAGGWDELPPLADAFGGVSRVSVVDLAGVPCIGYETPRNGAALGCLRDEEWLPLPRRGLPRRPALLVKLGIRRGSLVAVFHSGSAVTVTEMAHGRWRRLGPPLRTNDSIPAVSENLNDASAIDIALVDLRRRTRYVWSLLDGRWHRSPALSGIGGGPMPSGTVRLANKLYMPVIDADRSPWTFAVFVLDHGRWRRYRGPENRTRGNAQGSLRVVGNEVWAAWQENRPARNGIFDTTMYTTRIAPLPGVIQKVWAGRSVGPGDIETVSGAGRLWTLYTPGVSDDRHLSVAIRRNAR